MEPVNQTFCSVIIPTIGRDSLNKAVQSVLEQEDSHYDFELIVVNDSGRPLSKQPWQTHPRVTMLNTNKRERIFARNSGAAVARGDYLWFLDDDDWLLPGAIGSLATLGESFKDAVLLYGGIQVVDEEGRVLAERNAGLSGNCAVQAIAGAWFPIQSALIQTRAFFDAGGFRPYIHVTEDLDLCRRVALRGDFANTRIQTACLFRGETWETSTNYDRAATDTLRSRDEVISEPGAFKKMIDSAQSAYWYGRIFRVYASVTLWHLRQGNILTALDRVFWGFLGVLSAGHRIFNRSYWQAVKAHHVPGTLHFIMSEYEKLKNDGKSSDSGNVSK